MQYGNNDKGFYKRLPASCEIAVMLQNVTTQFYLHYSVPCYIIQEYESAHVQGWINMQAPSCPRRVISRVTDFIENQEKDSFLRP
jgi:hypothetical protein